MQKVVAIGSSTLPLDLQVACHGMLSRQIQKGYQVDIIIANAVDGKQGAGTAEYTAPERIKELISKSYKGIKVSGLHFVDNFDYSVVSQENVNVLRECIEPLNPVCSIIPFYKSLDKDLEILGRSALLACRLVKNLLMYDTLISTSSEFQPGIFATLSRAEYEAKKKVIADLKENGNYKMVGEAIKKMELLNSFFSHRINEGRAPLEAFQSHRLLLLSSSREDDLFS